MGPRRERMGERTEGFVDTVELAIEKAVPKKLLHLRSPRQNTVVNVVWRALVLLVGLSLISLGVLLLVLPGPGWGAIILGLVVLASEFTWANRMLVPVRRRASSEVARLRGLTGRQQAVLAAVTVCALVALSVLGAWSTNRITWTPPW